MEIVEKTRYSDSELQLFKELIEKKIEIAKEDAREAESSLAQTNDERGTVIDGGAITSEKEHLSQRIARAKKFIEQLKAALVRIQNKTYGICKTTGQLIPEGRLRAVPHTTECKEAKEKRAA